MSVNANSPSTGIDRRFGLVALFLLADTAVQVVFKMAGDTLGSGTFDLAWVMAALGSPLVWLAIGLYFAVFILWMMVLQDMEISRAFPLQALTYITVPAIGVLFFNETLDWQRTAGIALILSGVLLVGRKE
jgi:drug/metabolite transporter (DMT)-like permease